MFEKLETSFEKWKDCRKKKSFYQRDIRKKEKKRLSKATKYLENSFVFENVRPPLRNGKIVGTRSPSISPCHGSANQRRSSNSSNCVIKSQLAIWEEVFAHQIDSLAVQRQCRDRVHITVPGTKKNDSQKTSDNHQEPGWHFYFRVFRAQQSCRRDFQWLMKVIRRMGMSNMTQRQRQYDLSFQMFYTGRRRWSGVTQKQYPLSNDCLSSPAI